jgi:cytoskeletal protein RodZ
MDKLISITSVLVLSFSMLAGFVNPLFAQQNQTNMTSTQQNQTDIGTASELENLTAGNTDLLQNASDIGSQNTSITEGLQQEQTTTDTNMTNQTGAMTNETKSNATQEGEQAANKTEAVANETAQAAQGALNQTGELFSNVTGTIAENPIVANVTRETQEFFGGNSSR